MGFLNKIIDFDPIIKSAVNAAMDRVPPIVDAVEARIRALLPLLAATVVKAAFDRLEQDMPIVGNIMDIAEDARGQLNQIPEIDIPGISEHFDLTEMLRKLGR